MQERFFIIGCQRSGTTLMRLILECHPDVFCYDELNSYTVLQSSDVELPPHFRMVGFKVPRWTEQLTHETLKDDGLEGKCNRFYRGEKILFLVRDVYDTVASMLKLKGESSNWCELWVPRIIESKLAEDATFCARHRRELDIIDRCDRRLIGLASLYWKYKTEALFLYRDEGFPTAAVHYERLVSDARCVLEGVCAHLRIPFVEKVLRHNEFDHSELLQNGLTVGDTDPTKAIYSDSIGQWRRFLTDEDTEIIAAICGDLPSRVAALQY